MGMAGEQSVSTASLVLGEGIAPEVVVSLAVCTILLGLFVWIVWVVFHR
jgi:hypothetical protein